MTLKKSLMGITSSAIMLITFLKDASNKVLNSAQNFWKTFEAIANCLHYT